MLRPGDPPAPSLALVAGIALHRAVESRAPHCGAALKWPNDLMIGSAKLAGILLERSGSTVIAGFGVNLCYAPSVPNRPTTALRERGVDIDARDFGAVLALLLEDELDAWRRDGVPSVAARWHDRAHPAGTRLVVGDGVDAGLIGAYDGLDAGGALRLRLEDGCTHIVTAGDIRLADPT